MGRRLNLLPTTAVEFGSEDYWNEFFTKKNDEFEWYGHYDELAPLLRKCMNVKDKILIVGCGNSNLSDCLYSAGYTNQRNIDISSVVIKKMQKQLPHLLFEEDDVTNLSSSDEEFSCILDKGTFDALAPSPPSKTRQAPAGQVRTGDKSIRMLQEVRRVLKPNGRFICISLLQKHVAEILFDFFNELGWIIQISRCQAAETRSGSVVFPVYVCSFIKLVRPLGSVGKSHIIFFGADTGDRGQRLESVEEVIQALRREMCMTGYEVAWKTIGYAAKNEVSHTLWDQVDGKVRYVLHLVDILEFIKKNPIEKQFGIFIVPQGRETEYMFGTHEGRVQLARDAGFTRLCVIHLQRDQQYPKLEEVKHEVGENLGFLMPGAVVDANIQVPVLTVGNDLGERVVIHQGKSVISGDYVVEDVSVGTDIFRRLIFLDTSSIIQSEVPIKTVIQKVKIGGRTETIEEKIPVPHQLTCDHHGIMAISIPMLNYFLKHDENEVVNALLIGLGGGLFVSFLHHYFPLLRVTAVELDKEIVEVATKYFQLPPIEDNPRFSVVIDDGMKYIKETDLKYNVIMFDVDSKSPGTGLSCPPKEFLTDESLEATKKALTPSGIFALNFVCRSPTLVEQYMKILTLHFPFIYKFKLSKDVNTILLCFPVTPPGNSKQFLPSLRKSLRLVRDIQLQEAQEMSGGGKKSNVTSGGRKSKKSKANKIQPLEDEVDVDNLMTLSEEGLENLCSRFQLLRTKN